VARLKQAWFALKGRGFEPRRKSENNDLRGAKAPLYYDCPNI